MHSRDADFPFFDPISYGRRGPASRERLTPAQIAQVARTVHRTTEVMVKVLPAGKPTPAAVGRHLDYIGRGGDVELRTDDGQALAGPDVAADLVQDWDLDLSEHRRHANLSATSDKAPPRLVYKIIFSMSAGTPPDKVLAATQNFCRERFALQHRYVLALHTDEPHPHVHVVIKAVSEQGRRLYVRKATLREWRAEFARHLRAVGVGANATPRFIRGETTPRKLDGIYRAARRGNSSHYRQRVEAVAVDLLKGDRRTDPAKIKLLETRRMLEGGWRGVADDLERQGQRDLAMDTRRFARGLPAVQTESERLTAALLRRLHAQKIPARENAR